MKKNLLILFVISLCFSFLQGQPPVNHCDDCDQQLTWIDFGIMTFTIDDPVAFPPGCLGCQFQVRFKCRSGICNSIQRYQIQIIDFGFSKELCSNCPSPSPPLDPEEWNKFIFKMIEKILLALSLDIYNYLGDGNGNNDNQIFFRYPNNPEFTNKTSDYIEFWTPACWYTIQDDSYGFRSVPCNFDDCCIDSYSLKALKDHNPYLNNGGWGFVIKIKDVTVINNSNLNCENLPTPWEECSKHCDDYRLSENELIGPWKYPYEPPQTDIFENLNSDSIQIKYINNSIQINISSQWLGNLKTDIYNLNGELLKTIVTEKNTSEFSLNNVDFNYYDGIYFIRIKIGTTISVRKFIKLEY